MAGWRWKIPALIVLCIPSVLGESAGAGAFCSTAGTLIERVVPLNGLLTFALYEAWRLVGPVSVFATLLLERTGRRQAVDILPALQILLASWMRWRIFLGACVFTGILIALVGAGHIPVAGDASARIIGPAEPGWREPTLQAAIAWAAFTWPLYIIAVVILSLFAQRIPARSAEN